MKNEITAFAIYYANVSRIYYPGQLITGNVILSTNGPIKARGVKLKISGKAYVHWTERHTNSKNESETRTYTATEKYFSSKNLVWQAGHDERLPPGNYNFPINFLLPERLPSSFESTTGYVRYKCKASIDEPWAFDTKCVAPFTVTAVVDLNMIPGITNPVSLQEEKTVCCLCCASGPLSFDGRVNRTGFVPGERIIIDAEITNHTNRRVNRTECKLKQRITYRANGKSKHETRDIIVHHKGPIGQHGFDSWTGEGFLIPPIPPTDLGGCRIIDVDYSLKFSVCPSGSMDLSQTIPLKIGTIPLQSQFSSFVPAPAPPPPTQYPADLPPPYPGYSAPRDYGFATGGMTPGGAAPSAPPLTDLYPDMPPPSYAACQEQFGNLDRGKNYAYGTKDFQPMYPTYHQQ